MPSVLITGANRGIGLELARQYVADGWRVFATCRDLMACEALENLEKEHDELSVHQLDVTEHAAIEALAADLAGTPIDVLVNNAGVLGGKGFEEGAPDQQFGSMDYGIWARAFEVNTMTAMKFAEAFAEHVAASEKKIMAAITSQMGSLTLMEGGPVGFPDPGNGVGWTGQFPRDICGLARRQVTVEGLLGGGDVPFLHEDAGDMRPADRCCARQRRDLFIGDGQAHGTELLDNDRVPLMTACAKEREPLLELSVIRINEIAEDVELAIPVPRADLDAGDDLDAESGCGLGRFGNPLQDVVVRNRQGGDAGRLCQRDDFCWWETAVGEGGVEVKINSTQPVPPFAR